MPEDRAEKPSHSSDRDARKRPRRGFEDRESKIRLEIGNREQRFRFDTWVQEIEIGVGVIRTGALGGGRKGEEKKRKSGGEMGNIEREAGEREREVDVKMTIMEEIIVIPV